MSLKTIVVAAMFALAAATDCVKNSQDPACVDYVFPNASADFHLGCHSMEGMSSCVIHEVCHDNFNASVITQNVYCTARSWIQSSCWEPTMSTMDTCKAGFNDVCKNGTKVAWCEDVRIPTLLPTIKVATYVADLCTLDEVAEMAACAVAEPTLNEYSTLCTMLKLLGKTSSKCAEWSGMCTNLIQATPVALRTPSLFFGLCGAFDAPNITHDCIADPTFPDCALYIDPRLDLNLDAACTAASMLPACGVRLGCEELSMASNANCDTPALMTQLCADAPEELNQICGRWDSMCGDGSVVPACAARSVLPLPTVAQLSAVLLQICSEAPAGTCDNYPVNINLLEGYGLACQAFGLQADEVCSGWNDLCLALTTATHIMPDMPEMEHTLGFENICGADFAYTPVGGFPTPAPTPVPGTQRSGTTINIIFAGMFRGLTLGADQ